MMLNLPASCRGGWVNPLRWMVNKYTIMGEWGKNQENFNQQNRNGSLGFGLFSIIHTGQWVIKFKLKMKEMFKFAFEINLKLSLSEDLTVICLLNHRIYIKYSANSQIRHFKKIFLSFPEYLCYFMQSKYGL